MKYIAQLRGANVPVPHPLHGLMSLSPQHSLGLVSLSPPALTGANVPVSVPLFVANEARHVQAEARLAAGEAIEAAHNFARLEEVAQLQGALLRAEMLF